MHLLFMKVTQCYGMMELFLNSHHMIILFKVFKEIVLLVSILTWKWLNYNQKILKLKK